MPNYVLDSSASNINSAINKVVGITSTPTAGNGNTVTSSGVKTYVDNSSAAVQASVNAISKTVYTGASDGTVSGVTTAGAALFTKSYQSPDFTLYSDDVTVGAPHGLGGVPFMFQAYYKCHVANNGYSVGDLINMDTINADHQKNYFANATHVYYRAMNDHHIVDRDGTSYINITSDSGNWRVTIRAFL